MHSRDYPPGDSDYFDEDEEEDSDANFMYTGGGGDLFSLDAKKLTDMLSTKDIEVEMFTKEYKQNPSKLAFKSYADQLVNGWPSCRWRSS